MATGPATELIQATAASVGAGMLLGGFLGGLLSWVVRSRSALALIDWSTFGGLLAALAGAAEVILK